MERLPGFRDFYPEPIPQRDAWSAETRRHIFDTWRRVASQHGFQEYDGPPLEFLELFTLKSGDEIVGQLYNFTDKGERAVALRPEMTPTLARMVAAHARNYRKPMKWFAIPQLFRYERQQKGRLREHFQFNADIFGEADPAADAELIALLINTLTALGLDETDFVVRLSSRNAWFDYFKCHCTDPAKEQEFYQIVDKLEREDPEKSDERLKTMGSSLDEVKNFIKGAEPTKELQAILDDLRARGLSDFVKVDYLVIRGLAYYTGPVFEAFDRKGDFRAIAGGGRYDGLVKLMSGNKVDLPGLGFGMGDVVLTELLKARKRIPVFDGGVDLFCLIEDETLRLATLGLLQELRQAGLQVEYPLTPTKSDKQFKRAKDLSARYAVTLQRSETDGAVQVRVRDLRSRDERILPRNDVCSFVSNRPLPPAP